MRSRACLPVLVLLLSIPGCAMQRTVIDQSGVDVYPATEDELDFLDHVATLPVATNNDVLHGLFLLEQSDLVGQHYDRYLFEARRRGWIAEEAFPSPNESARIGMIAMAACDLLNIKGGMSMRLFGPFPRACTRELVYLEMIPLRTENQSLSGLEFIDLLSRIEDDMTDGGMIPVFSTGDEK